MSKALTISKGARPPLNKTETKQAMLSALAIKAGKAIDHHLAIAKELDKEILADCDPLRQRLIPTFGLAGDVTFTADASAVIQGVTHSRYFRDSGSASTFDLAASLLTCDNPTDLIFDPATKGYEDVTIRFEVRIGHIEVDFSFDTYEGCAVDSLALMTGLPEQVFKKSIVRYLHSEVASVLDVFVNDRCEAERGKWATRLLSTKRDTSALAGDERFQDSVLEFIQKRTSIPALPAID